MNLKELDLFHLTKLTSHQVDHVTCLECCKYYIAPETAICGHTLCHACWRGRRTCPSCAAPLEKKALKLNLQILNLTEHIHSFVEAFEKLFNIKLDEFSLDRTSDEIQNDADPTKHVKDWLASSQNQFSAPILNSEPFSQEISPIELSTSKFQVHMNSKKSRSPQKVIYVPPPQEDWDKIEQLPETDEICANNKENLTNQHNKKPYSTGDEYTTDKPRRSSRKRDYTNQNDTVPKNQDVIMEKPSSKKSSSETDKKSNKAKQNWNNVKKMRKEFSKLNKKNRSKLNVSIEMCKKTQSTTKANLDPMHKLINQHSQPATYTIEENTPDINHCEQSILPKKVSVDAIAPNNNNVESDVVMSARVDATEKVISDKNSNDNHPSVPDEKEAYNVPENVQSKNNEFEDTTTNLNESINTKIPFLKNTEFCANCSEKNSNLDDIEITLKIGNTLTNITIKRKNNDVQLRVKADREVQTSLGTNCLINKNNDAQNVQNNNPEEIQINIGNNNRTIAAQTDGNNERVHSEYSTALNKSLSTKKNTASADTRTAQFEITESVEKELSNVMECVETVDSNTQDKASIFSKVEKEKNCKNVNDVINCDEDIINDLDIFDNESVQEQHVQRLDKSKHTPSEILMPTVKTKSLKHPDKRDREVNDDDEVPCAKKVKTVSEHSKDAENIGINDTMLQTCNKDSESMNYDVVMDQVFASIDADIEKSQKSTKNKQEKNASAKIDNKLTMKSQCTEKIFQSQAKPAMSLSTQKPTYTNVKEYVNEKCSENVFSIIEKDDEVNHLTKKQNEDNGSTQQHIDNLLTPGMCQDLISTHEGNMELNKEQCTPFQEQYDSDKSVVEETPQKNTSFPKPKNVSDATKITNQLQRANSGASKIGSSQLVKSIINVSDTMVDTTKTSKDQTILEAAAKKTLETPLNINKFVDHIKHKSTPVARKSLNFDSENIDDIDPEQTLCPSSVVAKTTQEKEFMAKAFEQSPKSPVKKLLTTRNAKDVDLKYCIAGSCLSAVELTNLKYLCRKYDWNYVDKYTKELTHLVVGVDEENRSQRSVKYMCALAASKWIVSYEWVDACISTNLVVGESLYEALDGTGEPGPKRSRLAKAKLFQGITFYCMPPFSVLDVGTLKEMLEAAGGRVVNEVKAVRATADAPALLLAEPEHTQEDRFVYLALELNIVPVNYEWVLNCLGSYSLSSIHELLMCPAALLPPPTAKWPEVLISRDSY